MKFAALFLAVASATTLAAALPEPAPTETTICVAPNETCMSPNGRYPACCYGSCIEDQYNPGYGQSYPQQHLV
jgi:hypothetical protein